jgi:hypothetical protein
MSNLGVGARQQCSTDEPKQAELTQAQSSFMFVAFLTWKYIWQLLAEVKRENSFPLLHTIITNRVEIRMTYENAENDSRKKCRKCKKSTYSKM